MSVNLPGKDDVVKKWSVIVHELVGGADKAGRRPLQCGECGRRYLKFGEAKDCLELHDAYNTSFSFSERVDNMNRLFDHYKKANKK
jgi:hypothetical protein